MASAKSINKNDEAVDITSPLKSTSDTIINPIHPSVEDILDPKVKEIYNTYQGMFNLSRLLDKR